MSSQPNVEESPPPPVSTKETRMLRTARRQQRRRDALRRPAGHLADKECVQGCLCQPQAYGERRLAPAEDDSQVETLKVSSDDLDYEIVDNGREAEDAPRSKTFSIAPQAKAQANDSIFEEDVAVSGADQLKILDTIEPEGLNTVVEGWDKVEFHVDSGATETVVNPDMLHSIETREGLAQRRGVKYEVANGLRIPNLGEKVFKGVSEEGIEKSMTAQVCEVNKALLNVKKIVNAGNRIVFDDEGSYVESKRSGERMWMEDRNGVYVMSLYVKSSGF